MCKFKNNAKRSRIDECMKTFIENLEGILHPSFKIVACCCGHRKYPTTIIVKCWSSKKIIEIVKGIVIPRKRKFYKRDNQGYYYIPEVQNV